MTVSENLSAIVRLLNEAIVDAEKVDRGNKAAGTRVRTAAQTARLALQDLRKLVLETRKQD